MRSRKVTKKSTAAKSKTTKTKTKTKTKPSKAAVKRERQGASSGATETVLDQLQPEYLEQGARGIGDKEVEQVVRHSKQVLKQFHDGLALRYLVTRADLMTSLVTDFWTGRYRDIPYRSVALIVFALSYVTKSNDLLPDSLPVLGEVDDAIVVALCVRMVRPELDAYSDWKLGHASPA